MPWKSCDLCKRCDLNAVASTHIHTHQTKRMNTRKKNDHTKQTHQFQMNNETYNSIFTCNKTLYFHLSHRVLFHSMSVWCVCICVCVCKYVYIFYCIYHLFFLSFDCSTFSACAFNARTFCFCLPFVQFISRRADFLHRVSAIVMLRLKALGLLVWCVFWNHISR